MRLFLEDEGALDLKLPYEELATKVADAVLDYEKCPYEAQVELLLTMNEPGISRNRPCNRCPVISDDGIPVTGRLCISGYR